MPEKTWNLKRTPQVKGQAESIAGLRLGFVEAEEASNTKEREVAEPSRGARKLGFYNSKY